MDIKPKMNTLNGLKQTCYFELSRLNSNDILSMGWSGTDFAQKGMKYSKVKMNEENTLTLPKKRYKVSKSQNRWDKVTLILPKVGIKCWKKKYCVKYYRW